MFYLQALAVFPILNPKLTLTLGRLLGDRRGQPLLTEENLAQLCRLPWLRNGRIPEWLRLALVIELRANPDRTEAVRAAWSTLLAPEKLVGEGLPVEVIRAVDPVLPLAVARLLPGYQPAERDAVLLAFLRKDALPVLAFELPSIPLQASPNLQPAAVPSAAILPRGFASLALAEFCERFAYYGMRITLILYMTSYSGLNVDERTASAAYAIFVTAAFVFGLPGGLIGDRLVGSSRAVFLGGGLIIAGSLVMSFGDSLSLLYIGMCIAVFGVGLFKPNIAAEVAQMFPEGGARSNAAFTIYYSSINVGAFLSSLIVGWIADRGGFRIAYLITSLCMTLGVVVFAVNHRTRLRASVGERGPAWGLTSWVRVGLLVVALGISLTLGQSDSTRSTFSSIILLGLAIAFYVSVFQPFSPDASGKSHTGYAPGRSRALTFLGLFMGAVVFWCGFEVSDSGVIQALYVIRDDMGLSASLLQLLPPIFTIALSIPFAIHWYRRATRESVPQATGAKFGSGLLVFGAGVLLMLYAVTNLHLGSSRIVPFILAQLFISSAEILIAPIGLTAVAKLAPPRFLATTFGIWALASSIGNLAAGFFSGNMGLEPGDVVRPMLVVAGMVMATGILLVAMRRKIP